MNITSLVFKIKELDFKPMDRIDIECFCGAEPGTLIAYDRMGNAYLLCPETDTLTIASADLDGETEISLKILER